MLSAAFAAWAQNISLPPSGDNQKASITQWIGPVSVTINYNSPDVHAPNGEDRKGKIWGEVAHYGFIDQGFGTSKAAPWRAGANENTTISFSHDVRIAGKKLNAGTYGLFLAVEKEGPWTWIFSNNASSWGSYFYSDTEDALRVSAQPQDAPYTEWLTFGFDDRQPNAATAYLQWENKRVPLKIEVPNVNDYYLAQIRNELRNQNGFDYRAYTAAVNFCVQHNINLDEALTWADYAISGPFIGEENFSTLQAKANVLTALGKKDEASTIMDKAIRRPDASVAAIHQYGRGLIASGATQKALEVFQYNFKAHPEDQFTTRVGLARGYTAVGDKKNAIKFWEQAIKNLPAERKQELPFYESELAKLKQGK